MGETKEAPKLRSVHVPLTDSQWLKAKMDSASSGKTLGEIFAEAYKNGSAAPIPTR